MAESLIYRNKIEKLNLNGNITVFVNDKEISKATGNKKSNILYFKQKYGITIDIKGDKNIKKGDIKAVHK